MRPLAFLVLFAVLLSAPAFADPAPRGLVPPQRAVPGSWYVTELPALPAGADEVELFVVAGDGSGRRYQVAPEHAAGARVRWRMPRIGAGTARLVLRCGGPAGEREWAASGAFAVAPDPASAPADVRAGRDELRWHFGDGPTSPAADLGLPDDASYDDAAVATSATPREDGPAVTQPATGRTGPVLRFTDDEAPSRTAARSRRPPRVPLRN